MPMIAIPPSHPRAQSLHFREALVEGYRSGIVALEGLIAHGRGEAFDYLLGEKTTPSAQRAIKAAAASLLAAKHPVISVNGNAAALCARDLVKLAEVVGAKIEVNLFYRTAQREQTIRNVLEQNGARRVLGVGERASAKIPELQSERRRVDAEGILVADTVFVPLEDGDRTEALVKMGKKVIAVDLNPLSRTACMAQISIIDNIVRVLPAMINFAKDLKNTKSELQTIICEFDNKSNLEESLARIRGGLA